MSIICTAVFPHPPLIIPEVGRGDEKRISKTIEACRKAAYFIGEHKPDTIIITTPHSIMYSDYFHISPGDAAQGSFAQFGAPQATFSCQYDAELRDEIIKLAMDEGLPAGTLGEKSAELDHAFMVPLYFLKEYCPDCRYLRIGLSGLSLQEHYKLGEIIAQAAKNSGKRIAIAASGDLSHKLTKDGPYGASEEGPLYDREITEILGTADFGRLFSFRDSFLEAAAECGHRSFTIMAGALDKKGVKSELLSYEGPFGVGYGVATFSPEKDNPERNFGEKYEEIREKIRREQLAKESPCVKLARYIVENYVTKKSMAALPSDLPEEMLTKKAGAFVTLHSNGALRGCIGTVGPMYDNIAEEIRHNAVSACSRDPRFMEVLPRELPELEYSVDILGEMERIPSPYLLNIERYGVYVKKGSRSGLLLPHIDGVTTVDQQISIACQKAGINENEKDIELYRFEVVRYY